MIVTAMGIILAVIALWFAFYTEPLSEHLQKKNAGLFDAEKYAKEQFANTDDLIAKALPVGIFLDRLQKDKRQLVKDHARVLGIGSNYFFVVKGEGTVVSNDDNGMVILSEGKRWLIPTRHVFGNLARDASGWFDIDAFPTMTDFNSVSAAVNKYIEKEVLTDDVRHMEKGTPLVFCGAVEVSRDYIDDMPGVSALSDEPQVIPFKISK